VAGRAAVRGTGTPVGGGGVGRAGGTEIVGDERFSGAIGFAAAEHTYYTWAGAQTLRVSVEPCGGGFVQNVPKYFVDCPFACIRPFDTGATVTLTATPPTGYTFVGWKVADHAQPATAGACPGTGTCTVTMSGSKDVVAVFDGPSAQPVGTNAPRANEEPPPQPY
jgi:hypothetical protein